MKFFLVSMLSLFCFFIPVSATDWGFGLKQWVEFKWWVKDVELKWLDIDPKHQEGKLIDVIKWVLNRVLGILWLIALLVLVRWWFQMLTAAGDDKKYGAGQSHLKSAATALLYIGIAWFIVSILFYLLNLATT